MEGRGGKSERNAKRKLNYLRFGFACAIWLSLQQGATDRSIGKSGRVIILVEEVG